MDRETISSLSRIFIQDNNIGAQDYILNIISRRPAIIENRPIYLMVVDDVFDVDYELEMLLPQVWFNRGGIAEAIYSSETDAFYIVVTEEIFQLEDDEIEVILAKEIAKICLGFINPQVHFFEPNESEFVEIVIFSTEYMRNKKESY